MNKNIKSALRDINTINKRYNAKKQYASKVQKYLLSFSGKDFDDFCKLILSLPNSNFLFECKYSEYEYMFKSALIKHTSLENEFIWLKNIFQKYSDEINYFLKKQKEVDRHILLSQANDALFLIDDVNKNCGKSLWAIEYKTHIKKELLNENNTALLKNIQEKNISETLNFFIQQLIYKSESKNIFSFVDSINAHFNLMRKTTNEKDNLSIDYAHLFASYFIPSVFDQENDVENRTLSCMFDWSIVDQYLLFKKYMIDLYSKRGKLSNKEEKTIKNIVKFIDDVELKNLLKDKILFQTIDEKYLSIIDCYTLSDYKNVCNKIQEVITEDSNFIVFCELFSRTLIYDDNTIDNNLFIELAKNLSNILNINNTHSSINYLEKMAIKFNLSSWSYAILFQLYNIIYTSQNKMELCRNNMQIFGTCITPITSNNFKFLEYLKFRDIDISNLSNYRQIKILINSHGDISNEMFESYKKETIIKSDYLKDNSYFLLSNNKVIECASFFVDKYLENEESYYVLPYKELIKEIESSNIDNITIDIPIIYDIYNKKISNDKEDERREYYEDYILNFDTYKPSEYYSTKKEINKKDVYFLKYIAIPSIMDITDEFEGTLDLKRERLEILSILEKYEDTKAINIERDNIFDELVFEKLKASYNSSKLYVDVDNLRLDKEHEYKRLYDTFLTSKITYEQNDNMDEKDNDDFIHEEFISLADDSKNNIMMASTDLSDIVVQIYKQLLLDFVKNENYGLNKFISTEIRHDVFITQLRTCFERLHLVTIIGKEGSYIDNTFWREVYEIVNITRIDTINDRLNKFSADLDNILNDTNKIFNISTIVQDDGMFNFVPTFGMIRSLRNLILNSKDFDDFFDSIINFMWFITEKSCENIKKELQENFKERILEKLDELAEDIRYLSGNVATNELQDAIFLSRGQIVEEINLVSSWLNRIEKTDENYNLNSVLAECINMLKTTVIERNVIIDFKNNIYKEIQLTYIEARALMTSIYNALINSVKYSVKEKGNIYINIFIDNYEEKLVINIRNPVEIDGNETDFISEIKEKLSDKYTKLSSTEIGGTGIHKIYNLLKNVSNRFQTDVDISNNQFILKIGVMYENTTD